MSYRLLMPMISLQVSQELMNEFDAIQKKLGFSSRSEALRQSILTFLETYQKDSIVPGHKIATLTVHHEIREDILDKFTEIITKYDHLIKAVYQYNLKNRYVKVIVAAGDAIELNELYLQLYTNRLFTTTISYVLVPDIDIREENSV